MYTTVSKIGQLNILYNQNSDYQSEIPPRGPSDLTSPRRGWICTIPLGSEEHWYKQSVMNSLSESIFFHTLLSDSQTANMQPNLITLWPGQFRVQNIISLINWRLDKGVYPATLLFYPNLPGEKNDRIRISCRIQALRTAMTASSPGAVNEAGGNPSRLHRANV